ncbi:tyrosine-protein phosphatase [Silvibacterium dinghuense]|uniref:protein-tyrosine-phosphatase n=1 Tax=Silvibacterium dinghuense TaxID=1560006 RepID=A0A4Q1SDH8_9BACT|nr:CpsB/CapC family capsule biosynthesis tyrosine phosphatase [Silvibacterium dinghuense]RXS95286.1 exopolysaccharide biosynthesis protein [Silvibacterium dinghuense]GGH12157.1 tyrosine-protein phosphatase YwqE [Silvibacterium dinghuense]
MIDIHHHLLYGLDDGSPDIETSLAMAEAAAADGITHIVCTPHASSNFAYQPELNQERLAALRERLGDRITLGIGCDFHLSYDNIEDALKNRTKYTINQKKYLLVEFNDFMIPQNITDVFYELSIAGQQPIITHPERNAVIKRNPERMKDWIREGALVQITSSSLTGRFGKTAQALSFQFLEKNWVHFLATDAHNLDSRPPKLSEGYEVLEKRFGKETAERLCVTNPRAVFYGEDFPRQPQALDIADEHSGQPLPKKGFFGRLFSRD